MATPNPPPHPAPYFARKGGRITARTSIGKFTERGHTVINASIPPLVYTNGVGERLFFNHRQFNLSIPVPFPTTF
jgi:hypothetical protein